MGHFFGTPCTLWPLNTEWWWQHSQFLRCFFNSSLAVNFPALDQKRELKTVYSCRLWGGGVGRRIGERFFNVTNVRGEIQCADKTSIPKFERKNWARVKRKWGSGLGFSVKFVWKEFFLRCWWLWCEKSLVWIEVSFERLRLGSGTPNPQRAHNTSQLPQ